MKILLIILVALSLCLSGCNNDNFSNNNSSNNYTASRTSILDNSINNENINKNTESELSAFSTKIYTPNDKSRQKNIQLTCSFLNKTIVKSGETFSFCNTVGKATPERGYEKADIFDKDGNKIKGYGGRKLPNKQYIIQCRSSPF